MEIIVEAKATDLIRGDVVKLDKSEFWLPVTELYLEAGKVIVQCGNFLRTKISPSTVVQVKRSK